MERRLCAIYREPYTGKIRVGTESYGDAAPYNRLVFYECGSEYISLLVREQPALHTDLEQLFNTVLVERVQG